MIFIETDFDSMREWIKTIPGEYKIRVNRLSLFDELRYKEDYEGLFDLIAQHGGKLKNQTPNLTKN